MASFAKRTNSWRADVNRFGVRKTATFDTLAQAKTWALHEEARILSTSGRERVGVRTTILLRAALGLFMQEVYRLANRTRRKGRVLMRLKLSVHRTLRRVLGALVMMRCVLFNRHWALVRIHLPRRRLW